MVRLPTTNYPPPTATTHRHHHPPTGLPNGVLPAGPLLGSGDFGMTLQTNNRTGCVEFWLGLNSFWGLPPSRPAAPNNTKVHRPHLHIAFWIGFLVVVISTPTFTPPRPLLIRLLMSTSSAGRPNASPPPSYIIAPLSLPARIGDA